MSDDHHDSVPAIPTIRNDVETVLLPYTEGLNILASALDLSVYQRTQAGVTRERMMVNGARSILPIALARTITTVDGVHALLSIGRVEQAEILNRTLMDLEMDAFLLIGDQRALSYYTDWATVEQSRLALDLAPGIGITGRDHDARRIELAMKLLRRLDELDMSNRLDDLNTITAEQIEAGDLEAVLPAFCRIRYGSNRPSSWRSGFMHSEDMNRDDLLVVVTEAASTAMIGFSMPTDIRQGFETMFRQELDTVHGHRSAEVHNSPLSLNRLIDPGSWDIRITGDLTRLPLALLGVYQHLHRATILFLNSWLDQPDMSDWSALTISLNDWVDGLVPFPSPLSPQ